MFDPRVVGQRPVVASLSCLIEKGRVPNAILFFGPEGTGKAAMALGLVRWFYCQDCQKGGIRPCGNCRGCRKTASLNHPDFSLLFPFSGRIGEEAERFILKQVVKDPYGYPLPANNALISMEQIRKLRRQFSYGSFEGKWRTVVILHANKMRAEAANALLKTLEEPPEQSLFVLTAPSPDALLPTVRSRCQFLRFPYLSYQDIAVWLTDQMKVNEGCTSFIAKRSGGSLRRAQEMVEAGVENVQDQAFQFLCALIWREDLRTFTALEQLAFDRQRTFRVLKEVEVWLRDILIYLYGDKDQVSDSTRLGDLNQLGKVLDLERLGKITRKIESIRNMNLRNVNLQTGLVSLWRQVSPLTQSKIDC